MANPTTNYSFAMPTNTDLVKDLPADFEVFGQAVDTQMKTNADAAIAKSLVTTKGDIIAATGASTPARLAVGSNDQVLTADSTAATGMKWATVAGGGQTLLSTTTLSGTTTSVTGISGSYNQLLVKVLNPTFATGGQQIYVGINSSTTNVWGNTMVSSSATLDTTAGGRIQMNVTQDNTGGGCIMYVLIDNYASTNRKSYSVQGIGIVSGAYRSFNGGGGIGINSAITSIQVIGASSYAFNGGTVEVWGIK